MLRIRSTLWPLLTPLTTLALLALVAACDLEHEGGAALAEEATGGVLSTGGMATAGAGAVGASMATGGVGAVGASMATGGSLPPGGAGFGATGGSPVGGTATTGGAPTGGTETGGLTAGGVGTGGEPNDPSCPTTEPTDGSTCIASFGAPPDCAYEGMTCSCSGFGMVARWNCYSTACPPNVPWGDELVCAGSEGTTCPYGNIECVCENGSWNCG